jgi:hypothetical protein
METPGLLSKSRGVLSRSLVVTKAKEASVDAYAEVCREEDSATRRSELRDQIRRCPRMSGQKRDAE